MPKIIIWRNIRNCNKSSKKKIMQILGFLQPEDQFSITHQIRGNHFRRVSHPQGWDLRGIRDLLSLSLRATKAVGGEFFLVGPSLHYRRVSNVSARCRWSHTPFPPTHLSQPKQSSEVAKQPVDNHCVSQGQVQTQPKSWPLAPVPWPRGVGVLLLPRP